MKLTVLAFALLATASADAAEPTAAPPPDALSADLARQLSDSLPKAAPPAKPQATALTPGTTEAPGPEVLELPKMTVKQRPRPRLNPSEILGPKAFNDELAKKNLSAFDRNLLNKFTLPAWLGGVSAADRAREEYNLVQKRQFLSDVSTIAKAVGVTDPAAAKALLDAAAKP